MTKNFVNCLNIIFPTVRHGPQNESVFADVFARFHCVTDGTGAYWCLDSANITELIVKGDAVIAENKSANHRLFTLRIMARPEYNDYKVQCVTDDGQTSAFGTLFVKGWLQ